MNHKSPWYVSPNIFVKLHDPRFLCQPLFSEVIAKHICRVLSPNRPFQELNMYKDERYNVHRITFTFIKTSDLGPIRHTDEETCSSSWKFNFGKPLVASTLTCPHTCQFWYGHQSLILASKFFWKVSWEKHYRLRLAWARRGGGWFEPAILHLML